MDNESNYFMVMLPQILNFILYSLASICMAISYFNLRRVSRETHNVPIGFLATGFGFYFLSFIVAFLMSAVGLVFAQYLGMIVYHVIKYSQYILTIIGTFYFVAGAKHFIAAKS